MHTHKEKQRVDCGWEQTYKNVFYDKQKVHYGT